MSRNKLFWITLCSIVWFIESGNGLQWVPTWMWVELQLSKKNEIKLFIVDTKIVICCPSSRINCLIEASFWMKELTNFTVCWEELGSWHIMNSGSYLFSRGFGSSFFDLNGKFKTAVCQEHQDIMCPITMKPC